MISNFTHKAEDKPVEIHLVCGKSPSGEATYAYVAIYAHRVRDMKLSLMTKTTDLEKFGVVVRSGFGEPDEETKQYIKETYFPDTAGSED